VRDVRACPPSGDARPLVRQQICDRDTTLRALRLRYCWASELGLMARLAGLRLRERYRDWGCGPFTGESQEHISA
jgi:hypothetical protein